jgi:hypothetical protein
MFSFIDKMYGRSSKWRSVRNQHVEDNPKCAACGRKDDPEVHHIVPYHVDPSRELDPANLITLCGKRCHFVFGHLMDWKSWNENVVRDSTLYYLARVNRPYKEVFSQGPEKRYSYEIFSFIVGYLLWPYSNWFRRDD